MRDGKKISGKAFQQTASLLAATLESTADGLLVIDNSGKVTVYNNKFLSMWHIPESLAAKKDDKILLENVLSQLKDPDGFNEKVKQLYSQPEANSFDVLEFKDGRVFERYSQPQKLGNETVGRVWSFRDVTDRRRAEEELCRNRDVTEQLAQEIAIIAEIGKVIGSTLDVEEVYESFAAEVRKLLPFDRLAVNLHSPHEENVKVAYVVGEAISGRRKGELFPFKGSVSEALTRTRTGLYSHPKNVEEMGQRFLNQAANVQAGMRSLMGVPLIYRDEVIASLHFRSKTPNAYTERDLRLAERIGTQIAGAIGSAQMFSDLRKTENALRESEGRFRGLVEQAAVGVAEIEISTGRYFTVNHRLCKMVGRTEEELLSTTFQAITHPEDLHLHEEKTQMMLAGEIGHYSLEKRYLRKDGEIVWVNITVSPLWKPGEAPGRNIAVVEDITDRKLAEEALRESEERYRTLVENASDMVFRLDDTGHITFVNPAALRIMGYEKKEIIGRHYPTFIRADMQAEAMKFFGRQFVKGIPNTYSEYPVIVKDGHEIWLGQNTQLIFQDGKVVAFQAVARDITERRQMEQEIDTLAEIGRIISSTPDIDKVYEHFAETFRKIIPFDRIVINSIDVEMNTVTNVYMAGHEVSDRNVGVSYPLKGSGNFEMVRTKSSFLIQTEDFNEYKDRFPMLLSTFQAGFRSIMNIPFFSKGEIVGGLLLRSFNPYAYTDRDVRLAERVCNQIAGAIANARLFTGLKKAEQELKESEQRYRELSIVDDLTQLYNSRHFYFQLKIELDRSNRYEQPLTLLLLDLDNFKHFNDTYGHVEGDQVLRRLGQVVKRCLRETDFAYRYGGEEFTILLPMTTSADGAVTAERIRTEFKKETFSPAPGQEVHKTVSIGLAQYKLQEEIKAFVHRVDQLMYQGKKNGKDRVCSES